MSDTTTSSSYPPSLGKVVARKGSARRSSAKAEATLRGVSLRDLGAAVDAEGVKELGDRALGALAVHARRGSLQLQRARPMAVGSVGGGEPSTITWAPVVLERSSLVGRTA